MTATERLDQIEARANAAMDTPWRVSNLGDAVLDRSGLYVARDVIWEDADFIAHAPTDVPWLIEQVRFLLGELAAAVADNEKKDVALRAVLNLHREQVVATGEDIGGDFYFSECAQERTDAEGFSDYPCPTVRAVE